MHKSYAWKVCHESPAEAKQWRYKPFSAGDGRSRSDRRTDKLTGKFSLSSRLLLNTNLGCIGQVKQILSVRTLLKVLTTHAPAQTRTRDLRLQRTNNNNKLWKQNVQISVPSPAVTEWTVATQCFWKCCRTKYCKPTIFWASHTTINQSVETFVWQTRRVS